MSSIREYAILYVGSQPANGATALGGNALLDAPAHTLDGAEHTGPLDSLKLSTIETNTNLVLRPDGTGGVMWGPVPGTPAAEEPFMRHDVSLDFSDVPNDGDVATIYTPAAGEHVIVLMKAPGLVPISGGGITGSDDYIAIGRGAAADNFQAYLGTDVTNDATGDGIGAAGASLRQVAGGMPAIAGDDCPDTTPITAKAIYNGHGPASAGHAELVVLVIPAP